LLSEGFAGKKNGIAGVPVFIIKPKICLDPRKERKNKRSFDSNMDAKLVLTVTLILILGAFIGQTINSIALRIKAKKFYKQLKADHDDKKAIPVDDKQTCKTPHSWIDAAILDNGVERIGKICQICGFIGGTEMMLPVKGLEELLDKNDRYNKEIALNEEFLKMEDEVIKQWFQQELAAGLSLNKLIKIHDMGISCQQRLDAFKAEKKKVLPPKENQ
jgi:hypothetical protein